MSEFLEYARKDGLNPELSMADRAIASIIDCYESSLHNGELRNFRQLQDASQKVDIACYEYASNPDTRTKAVNLRSWHIVRLIANQYENIEPNTEWPYYIGLSGSDDFWRQVYTTTDVLLKKALANDYGSLGGAKLSTHDAEKNTTEHLIATQDNKAILRRELCYDGTATAHTAMFVVKAI